MAFAMAFDFNSFIQSLTGGSVLSFSEVAKRLLLTVLFSLIVYFVYKISFNGVLYSKNFNISMMIMSVVVCSIMMVIGSNVVVSLGALGSLSIVRFRTAVKDPRDIGFLFWSIAIGISCGTGLFHVAIVLTVLLAIVLVVSSKIIVENKAYLLIVKGNKPNLDELKNIMTEKNVKNVFRMKNTNGSTCEVTYEVAFKKNNQDELITAVEALETVDSVNLISYNGELTN